MTTATGIVVKETVETNKAEDILKSFQILDKKVIFIWGKDNEINVLVEHNGKEFTLQREDLDGIPKECFVDRHKMLGFLTQCQLNISEYVDQPGFKVRMSLKLNGGGNMGVGIKKWPVMGQGTQARIVIPYTFTASKFAVDVHNNNIAPQVLRQILQTEKGAHEKLTSELEAIKFTQQAIGLWNDTGLVELLTTEEYEAKYKVKPARWIKFSTSNEEGICRAPCIGMCDYAGEQALTCDLERAFHSSPVQSILHEIGHVLGLRHEHARKDRQKFVDSNLPETSEGSKPYGKYDFRSVMHYELGDYPGNEYLRISEAYAKQHKDKHLDELQRIVGVSPVISNGDKATVRKLYEDEFAAAKDVDVKAITDGIAAVRLDTKEKTEAGQTTLRQQAAIEQNRELMRGCIRLALESSSINYKRAAQSSKNKDYKSEILYLKAIFNEMSTAENTSVEMGEVDSFNICHSNKQIATNLLAQAEQNLAKQQAQAAQLKENYERAVAETALRHALARKTPHLVHAERPPVVFSRRNNQQKPSTSTSFPAAGLPVRKGF